MLNSVNVFPFPYSFIYWATCRLFPIYGYMMTRATMKLADHMSLLHDGASLSYMPRSGIAASFGRLHPIFTRNCHTYFQNVYSILYPRHQCVYIPLILQPQQQQLTTFVILTCVRWNFKVIWFTFPWRLKVSNMSLSVLQPFVFSLLIIICLYLYSMFLTELFVIQMSSFFIYLYILYISLVFDMWLDFFSYSVACYFVWRVVVFALQKTLSFIKFHLLIVVLRACGNGILSRKSFFLGQWMQGCSSHSLLVRPLIDLDLSLV